VLMFVHPINNIDERQKQPIFHDLIFCVTPLEMRSQIRMTPRSATIRTTIWVTVAPPAIFKNPKRNLRWLNALFADSVTLQDANTSVRRQKLLKFAFRTLHK